MTKSQIDIRPIITIADADQIEEVQQLTWNTKDREIMPGRLAYAMQKNGALLIGAFDETRCVGFVFGVLGTVEDLHDRLDQVAAARLLLYSTIMGVLPEYQKQGIGYRLKLAQREFALRIGVRLITWTYDPLESMNGYFNIHKLGVICRKYLKDYYGEMGGINIGLSTDRFYSEWWVTSNRVVSRVSKQRGPLTLEAYLGGRAVIVNECHWNDQELPVPPDEFLNKSNNLIVVEIPDDVQRVKSVNLPLASQWREHTRQLFDYYFGRKYILTDFVRSKDDRGLHRSYYILTQADGQTYGAG
jgi:predicted GNAT superfamily acetyltransferase